jgi:O-antigen ligase
MRLWRLSSALRERAGDFVVAGSLALFPLLPTGFTYLGQWRPWALEGFFLAVVAVGIVLLAPHRRDPRASPTLDVSGEPVRLVRLGYLTWLIPVVAAMFIGLMERTPFDWAFLHVEAEGLLLRLTRPMHQVADPFYPLRVGLTYLEGGLAFWLLSAAFKCTSQPDRRIRLAIYGCLVAIGLVSTIAILQYFTRANLLEYWVRANPTLTRSHSTLDDPNALASFLVLGIGLAGGATWSAGHGWADWRRFAGPLILLGLACGALVTTVSRAGLAALVIAPVVILIGRWVAERWSRARTAGFVPRKVIAMILGGLVLGTAALVLIPKRDASALPSSPVEAVLHVLDPRRPLDRSLEARLNIWKAAVDFGTKEWPLGIGLGQFPRLYSSYPDSDGPENAHNFFLQVFAESGLLGLAGFSVFLGTIAAAFRTGSQTRTPAQRALATWLAVGLLAFVLTWVTGHPLLNLSNQLWFASVLAVGLAALKTR